MLYQRCCVFICGFPLLLGPLVDNGGYSHSKNFSLSMANKIRVLLEISCENKFRLWI